VESVTVAAKRKPDSAKRARPTAPSKADLDPKIGALVQQIIARVADRWTMLILETLEEHGTVRFKELGRLVAGISQKMLTQTLRQMECDGLVKRTVHPVIPPHVDYALTKLGHGLGEAFCGVWKWAEKHYAEIEHARSAFELARKRAPGNG
jgi:DNA-binding HxlR family transcriptional regulator